MKNKLMKLLCLSLAAIMLLSCFVACGNSTDDPEKDSSSTTANNEETTDEIKAALDELGEIDWGGDDFTVLYVDTFKGEVYAENGIVDKEGGSSQVINDAVYERNSLFEDRCNLTFKTIEKDAASVITSVQNEASAPTGDFQMIDARLGETSTLATSGYLYDFYELGIDLEREWWDSGTAEFVLAGGVYFMSGSLN